MPRHVYLWQRVIRWSKIMQLQSFFQPLLMISKGKSIVSIISFKQHTFILEHLLSAATSNTPSTSSSFAGCGEKKDNLRSVFLKLREWETKAKAISIRLSESFWISEGGSVPDFQLEERSVEVLVESQALPPLAQYPLPGGTKDHDHRLPLPII